MVADVNYSGMDRLVHRIVFGARAIQLTAADIEGAMFSKAYAHLDADRPIFITSLPRAGTTVLLEAASRLPGLATHRYRDMPMVMAPILWSKLSARFRKEATLQERAHGDGLNIGYDSPEALEEVLWMAQWPEKYTKERILLWSADDVFDEGREFVRAHMQKIIALRHPEGGRYISKNNGNIARLDLLPALFPQGRVVVPVRRPIDHAASLLRQHLNFTEQHEADAFARRYMADIGHFEFGALHRPIAFETLDERIAGHDPGGINYWLGYWIAAFEHITERADQLTIVAHDVACTKPAEMLGRFCDALEIDGGETIADAASLFRPAPPADPEGVDPALREQAEALYATLLEHSII